MPDYTELRPMSIGEILERSLRLYRYNFMTFFGIILVVNVILFVVQQPMIYMQHVIFRGEAVHDEFGIAFMAYSSVFALLAVIAGIVAGGALTLAVSERFLDRQAGVASSYRRIKDRLPALIGTAILVGLIIVVGFLLCIIPGIYFYFSFILSAIVVVLERKGPRAAMSRSRELMRVKTERGFFTLRSNSAKALVILLIIFALATVVNTVSAIPQLLVAALYDAAGPDAGRFMYVMGLISGAINTVLESAVAPVYTLPIVLLYYDIRIRFEGYDLEMLSQSLEGDGPEGAGEDV